MKKPKPGTKAWMTYIRGLKGKKGHTKKSAKGRPEVVVSVPRNAKVTIKRKPHNPYLMDVTDTPQGTTTHHKWYTEDYDPSKAQ